MRYFAYGSNMSPDELRAWCPSAQFVARARLRDFRLDFTRYSNTRSGGVADIVPEKASVVWGIVYEIPTDEMKRLDEKEGVPQAYRRQVLEVESDTGERLEAVTYAVAHKSSIHPPSRAYLKLMQTGARHWRLPPEYIAVLESIETTRTNDD